mgnify:CR=1 FL=1
MQDCIVITPHELERYKAALYELSSLGIIIVNECGVRLLQDGAPARRHRREKMFEKPRWQIQRETLFQKINQTAAERAIREHAAIRIQRHVERTIGGFVVV